MCEICWECKDEDDEDHDFEKGDEQMIHPIIKCKKFLRKGDKNTAYNDRNTHVGIHEGVKFEFIKDLKKLVIFDFDECLMNESVAISFSEKTFEETREGWKLNGRLLMVQKTHTLLNTHLKEDKIQFAIASFGRREVIRSVLFKLFPDDHQKIYITTPGDYENHRDTIGSLGNKNTQIKHIMKTFFGKGMRKKDVIFYDDSPNNVDAAQAQFPDMTIHLVKPFPIPIQPSAKTEDDIIREWIIPRCAYIKPGEGQCQADAADETGFCTKPHHKAPTPTSL